MSEEAKRLGCLVNEVKLLTCGIPLLVREVFKRLVERATQERWPERSLQYISDTICQEGRALCQRGFSPPSQPHGIPHGQPVKPGAEGAALKTSPGVCGFLLAFCEVGRVEGTAASAPHLCCEKYVYRAAYSIEGMMSPGLTYLGAA